MQSNTAALDTSMLSRLLSEPSEPLDRNIRHRMESGFFFADFSHVGIHRSPLSTLANRLLGSRAFTVRDQIFFGDGAYQPDCYSGLSIIAHELTHIVQKRLLWRIPAETG